MAKLSSGIRLVVLSILGVIVLVEGSLLAIAYLKSRAPGVVVGGPAPDTATPPPSPFLPRITPTPVRLPAVEATPVPAERTPQMEVGELALTLRDYRQAFGGNPVGNNAEITRALLGENPRQVALLDRSTVKLNDQGELIDHWGHPYFFHAITSRFMEVRSAGPDGVMFTADDIVGD